MVKLWSPKPIMRVRFLLPLPNIGGYMKKLLKDLIEFKTVTDLNEFNKCFNYIKDYLKDSNLYIKEYSFDNKTSLVVSNTKSKKLDIIFCGHIDVVPGNNKQFKAKVVGNKMYGRGTYDMKGHDAVMIKLMKNLNTNFKVALFLTSDEEMGGFKGTDILLNKKGYTCKLAIVPDGGNNFNLVEEEKGVLQLELSYKGVPAHASTPFLGVNAIEKLMEVYQKIIKMYPIPKNEKDFITGINLGYISGGDYINRVPSYAKLGLDIRHVGTDKKEDIINNIKKIDKNLEVTVLEKSIEFKYIENDLSKEYLDCCKKVLKKKVKFAKIASSSDARFFYIKNISTIIMNASGYDMHGDNEYIELDSLDKLYEIYSNFINR